MARAKAAAIPAPQTEAEALALANDYAASERGLAAAELACEREIDAAKAKLAAMREQWRPARDAAFRGLHAWFAANQERLTGGKRRSYQLGPIILGERLSTPRLSLPKGKDANAVIAWLRSLRDGGKMFRQFVREKATLDRQALIKALSAQKGAQVVIADRLADEGLVIDQRDEFFIKVPDEEEPR